jgi:hypothetical protein
VAHDQPSLDRVVQAMSRVGQVRFQRDNGGDLVVEVTRGYGLSLYGTTDRFSVQGGMLLTAEVVVDDHLCRVEFAVDRAVFDSAATARIQLEALFVTCQPYVRRPVAPRQEVRGSASVTAQWCQSVVDGTTFEALTVALSTDGVVLSTWRALRPADRLALRTRLHGIPVEAELVVDAIRPNGKDEILAECRFTEPAPELLETVLRVIACHGEHGGVAPGELAGVRRVLVEADLQELERTRPGLLHVARRPRFG